MGRGALESNHEMSYSNGVERRSSDKIKSKENEEKEKVRKNILVLCYAVLYYIWVYFIMISV